MKIGIETSALMGKATGTSRYISCLLEQAATLGNEIIAFKPGKNSLTGGIRFLPDVLSAVKHGGLKKHLYRTFFLKNEMTKAEVDCGIFPDYFMPAGFSKPSAVIIHDLSFISHPQFYSRLFIKFYLHHMKCTLKQNPLVATISEYSKDQINKHLSIPKEKIFLLQAYSDLPERNFYTPGNNREKPYLLYVGHVEPRKNLNFLVENFLKWNEDRKAGLVLKIVGELWIKSPEIISMLNKYKNHPDVEFTGYVEEEKLEETYGHASAFVHTSFVEGFGMPVLEAMHYGLPILCTSGSATEEISKPYSVPVDPYKSESLIKGLDTIYQKVMENSGKKYEIKYVQSLMRNQLVHILENLNGKKVQYPAIKKSPGAEEAVEKTLLYATLFNSGVNKVNLHKHLFDMKLSRASLNQAISQLQRKKKIFSKNGVFYLNSRSFSFYNGNGNHSAVNKKSKKLLKILKRMPLISLISFSGGTAHYGFENHNDIDLFIISKPHTVYLAYFIIHFLSLIFKARNELCANYLIDEMNMEIKDQKDFYTAHQIITLVPYKNEKLLHYFWQKNEWVKDFFPNFSAEAPLYLNGGGFYKIFKPFNKILKNLYRLLYKDLLLESRKSGSLKLNDGCIKLHTNDYRFTTAANFAKAWDEYLSAYKPARAQNKSAEPVLIEEAGLLNNELY